MRCPNLNIVTRKKASLDLYRHENVKIISLFKNEVSTGEAGTIENHFIRRCWKTTMQQKRRLLTKLLLTLPCTPEILYSDDIHISPKFLVTHQTDSILLFHLPHHMDRSKEPHLYQSSKINRGRRGRTRKLWRKRKNSKIHFYTTGQALLLPLLSRQLARAHFRPGP